ncbi:hypothetical protein GJQ57_20600 [Ralstonia pickettii]|uniref:Uncharacterized protein n=1 Tax=Ralstonia pickettii TaxID=329 RepID=A0A7X2HR10_RALPI|nr:hypothetical protein [Ralstonia pickettii]MRT01049.1 hypothetical protein [Ralstonia pickettii]
MKKLCAMATFVLAGNAAYGALAERGGEPIGVTLSPPMSRAQLHAGEAPRMLRGVITALNLDKGEIDVHGNRLQVSQAVRVFGPGGDEGHLSSLRLGQEIRFLLDPKDASERTISVIYLQ